MGWIRKKLITDPGSGCRCLKSIGSRIRIRSTIAASAARRFATTAAPGVSTLPLRLVHTEQYGMDPEKTYLGCRIGIQVSKKHQIPDPDPQH